MHFKNYVELTLFYIVFFLCLFSCAKEDSNTSIKEVKDFALFISFPDVKAKLGIKDSSEFTELLQKYPNLLNQEYPVGHTGAIIVNSKTQETVYIDFGRFDTSDTSGNAITRIGKPYFNTIQAKFSKGQIINAENIVQSLFTSGYFSDNIDEYKHVQYATVEGLDYNKMIAYSDSVGVRTYGFGDNQTYCTRFTVGMLDAGGVTIDLPSMSELVADAKYIVKKYGYSETILNTKILFYLNENAPIGKNVFEKIKIAYPFLPYNDMFVTKNNSIL